MSETSTAPGFVRIDNRIITDYAPRFGPNMVTVYVVLKLHADNRTGQCFPSLRTICRLSKLSRPTVIRTIGVLEQLGLIKVERRRTKHDEREVNLYTLLPVEGGQSALPPVVNDVDHRGKPALPEQDLIIKIQENNGEGVRAPAPDAVRDDNRDHPAVRAYVATFGLTPTETQRAEIVRVVADVSTWGQVLRDWQLANYSERNIPGMLDRYRKEMRSRNGRNGHGFGKGAHAVGRQFGFGGDTLHEHSERGSPETSQDTAQRDAEWRAIVSEYGTRSSDCDS